MENIIVAVILVLGYKISLNVVRWYQTKSYYRKYVRWATGESIPLKEHKHQIIKLLKGAGIKDSAMPFVNPVGWNHVATGNASVFDNFGSGREDIVTNYSNMFQNAIGVYKSRVFETFSPFYWIDFVVYLPKNVLTYMGTPSESKIINVLQLVYWALSLLMIINSFFIEISPLFGTP